jgi:hypothetical protein
LRIVQIDKEKRELKLIEWDVEGKKYVGVERGGMATHVSPTDSADNDEDLETRPTRNLPCQL